MDDRVPVESVFPGLQVHPLPDNWTPLEAFVLIKSIDEAGEPAWVFRTSNPLNEDELLGVLVVQAELLKRRLLRRWELDEEPE